MKQKFPKKTNFTWCFRLKNLILKLFKFLYKSLYHSFAFAYNRIALLVSAGEWFDWVKQTLQFVDERSIVLEIGFGTGILFEDISKLGNKIFGIDESQNMIDITKKRIIGIDDIPKIVRGNAKNLPYSHKSFDLIIATFPSEFVFDLSFLAEIERVLTNGGLFVSLLGVSFNKSTFLDLFYKSLNYISRQKMGIDNFKKYFKNSDKFEKLKFDLISEEYNKRLLYFLTIKKL